MSSKVLIKASDPDGGNLRQLVWRKVTIRKSLDEICHYLEMTLPASELGKINKHDRVTVRCSNPLFSKSNPEPFVTTVMVDAVTNTADASQKTIKVIGRSPARDIIDSTWYDTFTNQMKLEEVANKIANKFGLKAFRFPGDPEETEPIFGFSFGSESPWTKLINEADNQGRILTSNELGDLYIWSVASGIRLEGFFISEGQNIREIQYTQNGAEQYHEYVVKADHREARVIDDTCRNNRILYINLTDSYISSKTMERRAKTEMLRRRENKTTVMVSGWGLNDSQLRNLGDTYLKETFWNPNFLIPVSIPSLNLNDNLLISQVEYTADVSSMTTALTLVNKEAYS